VALLGERAGGDDDRGEQRQARGRRPLDLGEQSHDLAGLVTRSLPRGRVADDTLEGTHDPFELTDDAAAG